MKTVTHLVAAAACITLCALPGKGLAQSTPPELQGVPLALGADGKFRPEPAARVRIDSMLARYNLLINQGRKCLKNGDAAGAIKCLEASLGAIPGAGDEPHLLLASIYESRAATDDVIRVLAPLTQDGPNQGTAFGHYATIRMRLVLALLEKGDWAAAVSIYEQSFAAPCTTVYGQPTLGNLKWILPGYQGPAHTLPQKHFSVDDPDYTGLQAQAHLILGARVPQVIPPEEMPEYMLGHLKQALKYDPDSLDAHFLLGILLDGTGKFAEARAELKKTARLAPDTAQAEIKEALKSVDEHEKKQKELDAWIKAHPSPPANAPAPAQE